jgi:hypothetical protein
MAVRIHNEAADTVENKIRERLESEYFDVSLAITIIDIECIL